MNSHLLQFCSGFLFVAGMGLFFEAAFAPPLEGKDDPDPAWAMACAGVLILAASAGLLLLA